MLVQTDSRFSNVMGATCFLYVDRSCFIHRSDEHEVV